MRVKGGVTANDVALVSGHIQQGMNPTTAFKIVGMNDPKKMTALKQLYLQSKIAAARGLRPFQP